MKLNQTVRKGAAILSLFLILHTFTVTAWSADAMKQDMDATFDAKFGDDFQSNFDNDSDSDSNDNSDTTQRRTSFNNDDSSSDDSSSSDNNQQTQTSSSDALSDSYWNTWKQDTFQNSNDETQREQEQDTSNDRTTRDRYGSSDDTNDDSNTRDSDSTDSSVDDSSDDSTSSVSPSGSTERQAEVYLHRYINQERQERGLAPLDFDSDLRHTAQVKSQDMARRGYFSHSDPEGDNFRDIYNENGVSRSECRLGAENIARTWFNRNVRTDTGSIVNYDNAQELADGLRRQWMTSDAHRDAILRNRYNEHGIGIEITSGGRVYASEHFCT